MTIGGVTRMRWPAISTAMSSRSPICGLHVRRYVRDRRSSGQKLPQPERDTQHPQCNDESRHLQLGNQETVDDPADESGCHPCRQTNWNADVLVWELERGYFLGVPERAIVTWAATTDDKMRTDPTERSIPAVMMTNVIPTVSTTS